MTRREDWEARFAAVVERHSRLPFTWGQSNCVYLAADVVEAITGEDPCPDQRGCADERDYLRRLAAQGHDDIGDAFAARLPEIPPAFARRGDVGVIDVDGRDAGVVVIGAEVIGKDRDGRMLRVARSQMVRAFKVG
ncbi:MAG TPA: hypothetical protein VNQ99_14955 [Xanthobacteraceae bacterium]|nr:hypothetical protein [Xanthobacteraceae bacterium]